MKPIINDITTSFENPPEFVEIRKRNPGRDYTYHPDFEKKQLGYYKLNPLVMTLSPDEAFDTITNLAKTEHGWKIIGIDRNMRSIEATAVTGIFRFKDDLVIEARRNKEGRTEIHMRSKSRLGKGDMGANYKRIQGFFDQIRALALEKCG